MRLFLSWAACLLAATGSAVARADAVTIFVDGVDFAESAAASLGVRGTSLEALVPLMTGRTGGGPAPDRRTSYLMGSWLGGAIEAEVPGRRQSVAWNGDLTDTASVQRAVAALQAAVLEASRRGDRIHVVAHSMGSVIAYLALQELARGPDAGAAYAGVDRFVTLASPLGVPDALAGIRALGANASLGLPARPAELQGAEALMIRRGWLNVYAVDDPLAGAVPAAGVRNARVGPCPMPMPAGVSGVCAHALPYLDYATIRAVVGELAGPAGTGAGAGR